MKWELVLTESPVDSSDVAEMNFCLSAGLGYHKDLQTRATFMEVLTKILQQGTEFDTLAETVLADRFERLVELVTMMGDQGELPIAMALANVVPCSQWVCKHYTLLWVTGYKN